MPEHLSELRPYKSYVFASIRDDVDEGVFIPAALNDVESVLALDPQSGPRRLVTRGDPRVSGELEVGFLHYTEERPATWAVDQGVVDTINQLIVICRRNRLVAIYLSEPRVRGAMIRRFSQEDAVGLGALRTISDGVLNAAFVRGQSRTLWLTGTHRRTSVKADNKILTGIDLRDALDPIDDQTYRFTSARSLLDVGDLTRPVGVTPRGSRVWAGPTPNWDDFRETTTALLAHLEATTQPDQAPLPVLAVPSTEVGNVEGAFDIAVLPPELLADDPNIDPQSRQMMERWAYHSTFEVIEASGVDFTAEVTLEGNPIGTLQFTVDVSDPMHVEWEVEGQPSGPQMQSLHTEALNVCGKRRWVSIRYESGHTVSEGAIIEIRHRDVPFEAFRWIDLAGYDVTREKPDPLEEIGNQDSLFCWTRINWPNLDVGANLPGGWLACDDGSMEIADFIHLDETESPPMITLIHVKGADNASPNRRISVSSYEVVTGQAVKNLRYLERINLEVGLAAGLRHQVGQLVWYDRGPGTRTDMIAALQNVGANHRRRVVILQPHVTQDGWNTARANPTGVDAARLRQLDTLLLSAETSCHALGAELLVVSSS